jgi:hypothetical protein
MASDQQEMGIKGELEQQTTAAALDHQPID